jgi:hypothetical protein
MPKLSKPEIDSCNTCSLAKGHKSVMKSRDEKAGVLDRLHIDTWGPIRIPSIHKNTYLFSITDEGSEMREIFGMQSKKEAIQHLKAFVARAETELERKVKYIRLDGAGEFHSDAMTTWAKDKGTQLEYTTPYTPEQNGIAERGMRTILDGTRSNIIDSGLPPEFWEDAAKAFVYAANRGYKPSLGMSPFEAWHKKKPDVSHLRVFGSLAFMYIHPDTIGWHKVMAKAKEGILIGYEGPGYRVYMPEENRIRLSSHVDVKEDQPGAVHFGIGSRVPPATVAEPTLPTASNDTYDSEEDTIVVEVPRLEPTSPDSETESILGETQLAESADMPPPALPRVRTTQGAAPSRSSSRIRGDPAPKLALKTSIAELEPSTIQEALAMPDAEKWKVAIKEEMASLRKNHTWDLVKRSKARNVVSCKWVFKVKSSGRYKARLVARGFSQEYGLDYWETYAPVARFSSIRLLLALAARHKLKVQQMDVQTAFLYGDLTEEIYMEQPDLGEHTEDTDQVCQLRKSLYGLKQAPRVWNQVIDDFLKSRGLTPSACDPAVYIDRNQTDTDQFPLMLAIYVDDLVIVGPDMDQIQGLKRELCERFDMSDLGDIKNLLGIEIDRLPDGSFFLHQGRYIGDLLAKHQMEGCKPVATPMASKITGPMDEVDQTEYQRLTGELMWPSLATRPDISYAVGYLARFNSKPTVAHQQAQKRVLRYLKGTQFHGILYRGTDPITGYCDSDWAGDTTDRKSTSGGLFTLYGGAITWGAVKQKTVALSSVEAEYVAVATWVKEALWTLQWLQELNIDITTIGIYIDSTGALSFAENAQFSPRTKHIDIKHHFIRDHLEKGLIKLSYIPTEDNAADALTKPLDRVKFEKCRAKMGILNREVIEVLDPSE